MVEIPSALRHRVFFFAVLIGLFLISTAQADGFNVINLDDAPPGSLRAAIEHTDLPAGATASLSIANLGGSTGANLGNSGYVEAVFVVLGAIPSLDETPVGTNGESNIEELKLLHKESVQLMPGQVRPITFSPNFATRSVIFATVKRPEQKHCLIQSAISISTANGFGIVGGHVNEGDELTVLWKANGSGDDIGSGEGVTPRCCACATVCGGGLCPQRQVI